MSEWPRDEGKRRPPRKAPHAEQPPAPRTDSAELRRALQEMQRVAKSDAKDEPPQAPK